MKKCLAAIILLSSLVCCACGTDAKIADETPQPEATAQTTAAYDNNADKIILDNEDVFIEVRDFRIEENINEYSVEFYVTNRSDKAIEISSRYAAVNGFVVDSYMYDIIAPGRNGILYLEILQDDINQLGLTEPDEIRFRLNILAQDVNDYDYSEKIFDDEIFLYPSGKSQ